jgi:hypothetical protein
MKKFIFFLVLLLAGLLTNTSMAQTLPPSDLLLWLRADAGADTLNGTVSRWHDQSGNGNDAIQTTTSRQPLLVANILNGKPVIRFDGLDDRLAFTSSTPMSKFTIFMVVKNEPGGGLNPDHVIAFGPLGGNWDQWYFILFMGVDNVTDRIEIGGPDGGIRAVAPNLSAYGEWRNISVVTNQTIYSTTLRWNGNNATMTPVVGTNMAINAPMGTGGGIAGTDGDPSGNKLTAKSDFAEVIIYNRAVTDSERTEVENYLSVKYNIVTGIGDLQEKIIPERYTLSQNYPNPFNPSTTISYSLPKPGNVSLKVYDILGKEILLLANEYKPAGNYSVQLNGSNLASGIYMYRLESGNYNAAKKLILMK